MRVPDTLRTWFGVKNRVRFIPTPEFVAAFVSGDATVTSKSMPAKVGDVFFCSSYGSSIVVTGATVIASQGQSSASYPYCIAQATSTTVTFALSNGASSRFQIGQFR